MKTQSRMDFYFLRVSAFLCTSLAVASKGPSVQVSQSPRVISLMRLNSSAEISCSATVRLQGVELYGLALKRRFSGDRSVLYTTMIQSVQTLHDDFKDRLSVTGDCCDFTIKLSSLKVEDTDGYYCSWQILDKNGEFHNQESNYTTIIVRERDPEEPCNRPGKQLHRLFLGLSVVACAVMFLIFTGALIWRCSLSKGRYDTQQSSQHELHHHHRRRPAPPPPPPPHQHHHHHHHHHTQHPPHLHSHPPQPQLQHWSSPHH
ncbi:uncharacterized protein LOC116220653 isoform X2 [Clupea harengus]|uniref:Uncharacterized protein LOC116220653 isoform X2 n=1 Tax=Clupea harengus TaxID=7950 RepID=A0A6P8FMR9_CLUHA|nr:uncharacterized protein LOC116220653 isoform X2 [Clupea harengus]